MRTSLIATIPKALDILVLVLLFTSLFLLTLGKPLITEKFEYLPTPTPNPQPMPTETSEFMYLPDGHRSFNVGPGLSISVSFGISLEATHYSIVYKIFEIYKYVDYLQWIPFLSSVYLFVRVIRIIGKKTQIATPFLLEYF
jgi:hypothetical protein